MIRLTRALILSLLLFAAPALAGPPYVTDDPDPVPLHHFEVYLSSQSSWDDQTWTGTAPHVEINYGALPGVQLHLIVPGAFSALPDGTAHYGIGDIELGAKVRFVEESRLIPELGLFALVEVPSGDPAHGLGAGATRFFLPLWVQKSFGAWTAYGGFGYWFNFTVGGRSWWFFGAHLERRLSRHFTVGAELFYTTPEEVGGSDETDFNLGLVVDVTDHHHLLLSAGRGLEGPNRFQSYVGYQLTFGLGHDTDQK